MSMRSLPGLACLGLALLSSVAALHDLHQEMVPRKRGANPARGDDWAIRATYPTFQFSPSWMAAAAQQDRQISRGLPKGEKVRRRSADRPMGLDPAAFTLLGPKPLDGSWGSTAGRVNVIVSDPVDPQIAYLGADGGGVWKTENCCGPATTWEAVTDIPAIASIAIGDMVLDPNDHNVVYAGTGDLRYGSFSFGTVGLLRSPDQGATWEVLGEDVFNPLYPPSAGGFPQYQAIGKVVVDPRNSANLIVGTKTGLYFSYDTGQSWAGPCLTNAHTSQRQDITGLLAIDTGSATRLIAAVGTRGLPTPVQPNLGENGANGIYRGEVPASGCPASWTQLGTGLPADLGTGTPTTSNGRIELAVAPTDSNTLYAMIAHATNRNVLGVWRSTDGGDTWTQRAVTADVGTNSCTFAAGGGGQMWYDAGLTIDPANVNVVYLSGVDLYRSTNGADTFQNLTCGYDSDTVHVDHHARAFVGGDSNRLLIGSDGGVYYSANATSGAPTFTPLNDTLSTIEFYFGDISGDFANSATPGASGGAQDNGSSVFEWAGDPAPANWVERMGGDGITTRIEPVNQDRWYFSSQNGSVAMSTTGPFGALSSASGAWNSDRKSFLMPFEIYRYGDTAVPGSGCTNALGCSRLIAGTYRVWETVQGAAPTSSWYPNSPDLTKNNLIIGGDNRSFINQLTYSFTDPSIAVVGTNDGNVWMGFGLGQGTANTANWVNLTGNNVDLPNRPVQDVVTDAQIPTIAYAALGGFDENTPGQPGHVLRVVCDASCSTFEWQDKTGNLPNIPVNAIMVNPRIPGQVFAGTDWGLYYTDDIDVAEPVWQRFDEGLPHAMIWEMVVDRCYTTLAVFTRSRGAFAWPLPMPAVEPEPIDRVFADDFDPAQVQGCMLEDGG